MAGKKDQGKAEDKGKVRATFFISKDVLTSLRVLVNQLQGEAIKRGEAGQSQNQSLLVEEGIRLVIKKYSN